MKASRVAICMWGTVALAGCSQGDAEFGAQRQGKEPESTTLVQSSSGLLIDESEVILDGSPSTHETGGLVGVNSAGHAFLAGSTDAHYNFGNFLDGYVHEYDTADEIVWSDDFDYASSDVVLGVAVDVHDNLLILVGAQTTNDLGSLTGASNYLRKYSAAHTLLINEEVTSRSGPKSALGGVATDSTGNIIVSGAVPATGRSTNARLIKRTSDNVPLWAVSFGTDYDNYTVGVAVDSDDNVLVGAYGAGDLRSSSPSEWIKGDGIVRKYSPAGNLIWERTVATTQPDTITAINVDAADNVFVAGTAGATLPGATLTGVTRFVRKYDPSGNVLWTWQSKEDLNLRALLADIDGNLLATGVIYGTSPSHPELGNGDAILRLFGADGTERWTERRGGPYTDSGSSLVNDRGDGFVWGGYARDSNGKADLFMFRFGSDGLPGQNEGELCSLATPCAPGLVCGTNNGADFGLPPGADVCTCPVYDASNKERTFCSQACPCELGQGGCVADSDCASGLLCTFTNVGSYGFPSGYGVCIECPTFAVTHPDGAFCSPQCQCSLGEGDCDSDADCAPGTLCGEDRGPEFGLPAGFDVCVVASCRAFDPKKPAADQCSVACPCAQGEGDCDSDTECASGLFCHLDVGPEHGLPTGFDVCLDCGIYNVDAPDLELCSPDCLCREGQGNCDEDEDCQPELHCATNAGPSVGLPEGFGVCKSGCREFRPDRPRADFCSKDCPCEDGEGDCDSDSECVAGTYCGTDNGSSYGLPADFDVCTSECGAFNPAHPDPNLCNRVCKCPDGQGDCDSDLGCAPGTVCVSNVGADYGLPSGFDVCEARSCHVFSVEIPSANQCSLLCPCDAEQGDCDADFECNPGLKCGVDNGPQFGLPTGFDVCVPRCSAFDPSRPDPSYCSPDCPCDVGQGDCDSDADCQPGLFCGTDNGPSFGFPREFDMCRGPCPAFNPSTPGASFCSASCPCAAGEGDCDADKECQSGLHCAANVGADVGLPASYDICLDVACPVFSVEMPNTVHCGLSCPCPAGEGDCDSDAECAPGLRCGTDNGPSYGLPPGFDVCIE